MILCAFSCPPLPLMVMQDVTQADSYISSHDIIACAMHSSNCHYSSADESRRVNTQKRLLHEYNDTLDALYVKYKEAGDDIILRSKVISDVYNVMQDYTRKVIASYALMENGMPDARFMCMDDVCSSDVVCVKTKEHLVANRIVSGGMLVSMTDVLNLSYRELIEKFFVLYSEDAQPTEVVEI